MAAAIEQWHGASDLRGNVAGMTVTEWASEYIVEHYEFTDEMKEALAHETGLSDRPVSREH
ncbi:MAG: hypothetical protein M3P14_05455 [Chloroflexota bacterium]|nr:hypothetical protein [Chloroflexota bacterium]